MCAAQCVVKNSTRKTMVIVVFNYCDFLWVLPQHAKCYVIEHQEELKVCGTVLNPRLWLALVTDASYKEQMFSYWDIENGQRVELFLDESNQYYFKKGEGSKTFGKAYGGRILNRERRMFISRILAPPSRPVSSIQNPVVIYKPPVDSTTKPPLDSTPKPLSSDSNIKPQLRILQVHGTKKTRMVTSRLVIHNLTGEVLDLKYFTGVKRRQIQGITAGAQYVNISVTFQNNESLAESCKLMNHQEKEITKLGAYLILSVHDCEPVKMYVETSGKLHVQLSNL